MSKRAKRRQRGKNRKILQENNLLIFRFDK